jgi:hypothetical protein
MHSDMCLQGHLPHVCPRAWMVEWQASDAASRLSTGQAPGPVSRAVAGGPQVNGADQVQIYHLPSSTSLALHALSTPWTGFNLTMAISPATSCMDSAWPLPS